MFRRLKGFWRIATKYDKLDLMFSRFIHLALYVIAVGSLIPRSENRP
jgi:transposase